MKKHQFFTSHFKKFSGLINFFLLFIYHCNIFHIKGTIISVISSDPPCKDDNARFKRYPNIHIFFFNCEVLCERNMHISCLQEAMEKQKNYENTCRVRIMTVSFKFLNRLRLQGNCCKLGISIFL